MERRSKCWGVSKSRRLGGREEMKRLGRGFGSWMASHLQAPIVGRFIFCFCVISCCYDSCCYNKMPRACSFLEFTSLPKRGAGGA
jgi:hypothetical protein